MKISSLFAAFSSDMENELKKNFTFSIPPNAIFEDHSLIIFDNIVEPKHIIVPKDERLEVLSTLWYFLSKLSDKGVFCKLGTPYIV